MKELVRAKNPMNEDTTMAGDTERKSRVLFICTYNSARSQMAEGYLRSRYGHLFEVGSAGTEMRGVHPVAIAVMEEIGIEISGHRSTIIDEFFDKGADIVVTVCNNAYRSCPFFPGAKTTIHAAFPDPSTCTGTPEECLTQFRQVRNNIMTWIDSAFVPEYGHRPPVS